MDTTLKQKARKVAAAHFILSAGVFCALALNLYWTPRFSGIDSDQFLQLQQYLTWHAAWSYFLMVLSQLLQPQILIIGKILSLVTTGFGFHFFQFFWILLIIEFLTAPVWSICFGWLFVKLDNWLNHFPVLGRRIF
jgi:hypothetical protein